MRFGYLIFVVWLKPFVRIVRVGYLILVMRPKPYDPLKFVTRRLEYLWRLRAPYSSSSVMSPIISATNATCPSPFRVRLPHRSIVEGGVTRGMDEKT